MKNKAPAKPRRVWFYSLRARLILAVIFITLFAMTLAATVGTLTPLVLKRFDIDAAVATGPFVTTAIDIVGVLAYFSIAKFFLHL